jgi:hypothetical protein
MGKEVEVKVELLYSRVVSEQDTRGNLRTWSKSASMWATATYMA